MKIGILTFHRAHNFGAFLQAFALKTFLEEKGHDVEFLDYWPKVHADGYKAYRAYEVHSLGSFMREVLMMLLRMKKTRMFRKFQTRYLNVPLAPRYTDNTSLAGIEYDVLVYGSDQIWWKSRLKGEEGFDPLYWGEYLPQHIHKVTYAASMGVVSLSAENKETIKGYIHNFKSIAVRESQLRDVLCELTDKEVHVTIDPTLLLTKQQWLTYCRTINESPYVLYYEVMSNEQAEECAKHIAKERGCKLIKLRGHIGTYKRLEKYTLSASPFDFISLIHSAEYIVSTSFHGVAFSVIFEKQFVALGMGSNSGRVASLLTTLGISERLIEDGAVETIDTIAPIDYHKVNQKLTQVREHSVGYLSNIIA